MIYAPINATLPATGAGAAKITLPAGISINTSRLQARGAVDMKISNLEALTTYYTIKSGASVPLTQVLGAGEDFFWAESGGTASVVEILAVVS